MSDVKIKQMQTAMAEMLEALESVEPAVESLIREVTDKGTTNWGAVNDCLCQVSRAIAKAKAVK